jgi:uncharacterized membrane protein (GlpM family)
LKPELESSISDMHLQEHNCDIISVMILRDERFVLAVKSNGVIFNLFIIHIYTMHLVNIYLFYSEKDIKTTTFSAITIKEILNNYLQS